jgi:hypothetical protein
LRTASASRFRPHAAAALLALLALAGCAERDLWPAEKLDPETAVSLTVMAQPWVYSHDVPMLAANARDYLNVGVVETNRAGTRAYWLGIVAWTTIDRSGLGVPAPLVKPGRVTLTWPERSLELQPAAGGRAEVGTEKTLFAGPQPAHEDAWYRLTEAQLALLAKAPPSSVALVREDGTSVQHLPWDVNPAAMGQFVEATGFTLKAP